MTYAEHAAAKKAARKAQTERSKAFLREWYANSPSGSVLGDFAAGNFVTVNADKRRA